VSYPKHGLATESFSLGKAVLALSALGIFSKLLNIDLSKLQVLGISFSPATTGLIPGFLGLTLMYVFVALCVARGEAAMENATDPLVIDGFKKNAESKALTGLSAIGLPFSVFVYSMPYVLGILAIVLLWSDSMAVLAAIWQAAT